MTPQEFKKVGRLLKELYLELKQEILNAGVDIFSEEYDIVFKRGQERIRELVLQKLGYTLEQYREAKALVEAGRNEPSEVLENLSKEISSVRSIPFLSEEQVKDIALKIARAEVKPPQIVNQIVREVEKPTVIHETTEYDDFELKLAIEEVRDKVDSIKLPEGPDVEKLKEDLKGYFTERLKENINIMSMPDFRKLAMGLQAQIDELSARVTTQTQVSSNVLAATGTIDDSNTAFTFPSRPSVLVINGGTYRETGGAITWTWSSPTATLSVPVGTGGSIFGLV